MPIKKDKIAEDDYYSNLSEENKASEKPNIEKSLKTKPKPKVKKHISDSKKSEVISSSEKNNNKTKSLKTEKTEVLKSEKTEKKFPKKDSVKKEGFKKEAKTNSPIKITKKEDIEKPVMKKKVFTKPSENTERKPKAPFNKEGARKEYPKWPRNNNSQPQSKPVKVTAPDLSSEIWDDSVPTILEFSKAKPKSKIKKSFGNDKTAVKKWRKPATKYKKEEKMWDFTRSHVLQQKKKEEKNIEDIAQDLKDRAWETVILPDVINVKEFSEKIWIPLAKLMAEFMKNGMLVNLNSSIDFDTATIIADAFEIKTERDSSAGASIDDIMRWNIADLLIEDDQSKLISRPPVVSIMGHVDHGKTSLLDYIRAAKVAEWESGWITQSIWAYQVKVNDKPITFLDTPGHEAFTIMRARWAKSTDVAVLVVAADEWVKPQTLESISHAKEAGIPVVVAINKMDKEWANPDHIKWQLAENGLTPDDWGGDTPMVKVSAKTWEGIDDLLETLAIVSDMLELKANPDRAAIWTIIESHLDKRLWPVSSVLINWGTINKWDNIVCWASFGKVKVLKNYLSKNITTAIPGDPVYIVGLDSVVEGWDILQVVSSPELARKKASEFDEIVKAKKAQSRSGIEVLMAKIKTWMLKNLKVVVKADTNGSLEAIKNAILKISNDEVMVTIAHAWVGHINESDVLMAAASQTVLIWFNVELLWRAATMVEDNKIEAINHKVIYHITDRLEMIASGMLDPKIVEIQLWEAEVKAVFYDGKKYMVVWLWLKEWNKAEKWAKVRIIRWGKLVWKWDIQNLKQWVEDVKEVEGPVECWIQFAWDEKLMPWDIIEMYKVEIHDKRKM